MDITKVRYYGEKAEVEWTSENQKDTEGHKLKSNDEPLPEFKEALEALKADFMSIMELPQDVSGQVVIKGLNRNAKGNVQIIGGLKVEAGFSSLNTPLLHPQTQENVGGPAIVTDVLAGRIDTLLHETARYVSGKRGQIDMGLGEVAEG